jgi:hypothetical protein
VRYRGVVIACMMRVSGSHDDCVDTDDLAFSNTSWWYGYLATHTITLLFWDESSLN